MSTIEHQQSFEIIESIKVSIKNSLGSLETLASEYCQNDQESCSAFDDLSLKELLVELNEKLHTIVAIAPKKLQLKLADPSNKEDRIQKEEYKETDYKSQKQILYEQTVLKNKHYFESILSPNEKTANTKKQKEEQPTPCFTMNNRNVLKTSRATAVNNFFKKSFSTQNKENINLNRTSQSRGKASLTKSKIVFKEVKKQPLKVPLTYALKDVTNQQRKPPVPKISELNLEFKAKQSVCRNNKETLFHKNEPLIKRLPTTPNHQITKPQQNYFEVRSTEKKSTSYRSLRKQTTSKQKSFSGDPHFMKDLGNQEISLYYHQQNEKPQRQRTSQSPQQKRPHFNLY